MENIKKHLFKFIILFYVLIHMMNALLLLQESIFWTCLWIGFALFEFLIIFYASKLKKQGKKLGKILEISLSCWLIAQSLLSSMIMFNSVSPNTAYADKLFVLGYKLDHDIMSDTLEQRLDKAIQYVSKYPETKIVCSGGITKNNTVSEASLMKDYLIKRQVQEEQIMIEENSKDTIENMKFCKELVEHGDKVVVITSRYHCARVKAISSQVGLKIQTIGADYPIHLSLNQLMIEKIAYLLVLLS